MVLHHVAQRAGLLVVAGARADAFLLGHGDLHVVDVLLVEQRLEDAVGEPEHQDVLDGLLAEIVIDAVDLALVEHLRDRVVDRARAVQVAADRLLDDEPRERADPPAVDEPRAGQLLHRRREQRRRHRQVVDPVAGQTALVLDDVEPGAERRKPLLVVDRRVDEEQRLRERLPRRLVDRPPREPGDAVLARTRGRPRRSAPSGRRRRWRCAAAAGRRRAGCRAPAAACDARGRRCRRR